jgi:hypothetical protein
LLQKNETQSQQTLGIQVVFQMLRALDHVQVKMNIDLGFPVVLVALNQSRILLDEVVNKARQQIHEFLVLLLLTGNLVEQFLILLSDFLHLQVCLLLLPLILQNSLLQESCQVILMFESLLDLVL